MGLAPCVNAGASRAVGGEEGRRDREMEGQEDWGENLDGFKMRRWVLFWDASFSYPQKQLPQFQALRQI